MGCSGLTLSRSILSLSDSWRNSAIGMCDSSAGLAAADTHILLMGTGRI
jgi:hypothetical protein